MIETKFGIANLDADGYYHITSRKEGNNGKYLHRLIFEDFYQTTIPNNWIIHHDDGNKLNNEIWNLVPMTRAEHVAIHKKGVNSTKSSKTKTSTGYYRVYKQPDKLCKQGFIYSYRYPVDGKIRALSSVDIHKLEEKVKSKGLDWFVLDEQKAMECGLL